MTLEFSGEIIYWRGPAPFLFVRVPPEQAAEIRDVAKQVTYGWGCIPVEARIGETKFTTSLFPKDGGYLLPVKVAVQKAEQVGEGDTISARIDL